MGKDLMGAKLKAPLCPLEFTYCLPMDTIKMDKGTGVVTSVPSDSPADYITFTEIKKKIDYYKKEFGVKEEWIMPFECIDIIDTPSMGGRAAEKAIEEFKIQSSKDHDKLEKAKEKVYKEGFYSGVMNANCGDHAGMKVEDAKLLVRQKMLDNSEAFLYWEPESEVISRSGVECVVALTDQWSMRYGEEKWRAQIEEHIKETYETYMPDTKNLFLGEAARLTEWGCSRAYGLGTKVPFDDRFVIESLSDSTIYMAYYTIAHYLQSGPFDGSKQGSAGIKPEQMTDEVYDYIFRGAAFPSGCDIPQETLDKMRAEFEYWYNNGYDLRCSGKDLIGNHLTFSLYNHAAIFPDKMPRSCFTNGHVLMDGKKMSKSEGNFLTLEEAIGEYSADGARVTCANAGDSNEFANFERDVANSAVLELFKLEEKASTMLNDDGHREGEFTWHDKMFAGDIEFTVNVTAEHFNGMRFREGLKTGFYEFLNMQARYKTWTGEQGMHKELLKKYLQMQALVLAPICPHTAEAIWAHGGGKGSIFDSRWPEKTNEFTKYHRASVFLHKFIQGVREQVEKSKKGKKPIEATKAVVYIANSFSAIQQQVLDFLRNEFDTKGQIAPSFKGELQKILTTEGGLDKKAAGVALGFAAFIVKNFEEQGPDVLDKELPFDQAEVLQETAEFFKKELGLDLEIHDASSDYPDPKKKKDQAYPAAPQFYLE